MFLLSEIEHTLRVPPHLLSRPLNEAIKGELDSLFLDKIIENLGLCISVYDIHSIDGGFIPPGEGASTYKAASVLCSNIYQMKLEGKTVTFRMVMFRPFVGEVISARLKDSNKDGLRLSLGFFDDIYVPVPLLPIPNRSEPDPVQKDGIRWIWEYGGENYPLDGTDEVRFRVHKISYPPIPVDEVAKSGEKELEVMKPLAPMVITGSLDGDGLGPISWWV